MQYTALQIALDPKNTLFIFKNIGRLLTIAGVAKLVGHSVSQHSVTARKVS